MFPEERQKKIIGILDEQKSVRVAELSKMLETSEVTIRRDLEELDKQNKLIRIHGGAMSAYSVGKAISAPELISNAKCIEEKRAISKLAEIKPQTTMTLYLWIHPSTVYELVKLIAAGTKRNLIIVTTSPLAVTALKDKGDNCKVIMLGGEFNYTHNTVEGYMAACLIKDMRADKCFFGINGIDESFGRFHTTPGGRGDENTHGCFLRPFLYAGGQHKVRQKLLCQGQCGSGLHNNRCPAGKSLV